MRLACGPERAAGRGSAPLVLPVNARRGIRRQFHLPGNPALTFGCQCRSDKRWCCSTQCERLTERRQMVARSLAISDRTRGHNLLAVTGPILHQRTAEIAARETPCFAEINHAVMNVDLRPGKFLIAPLETEHRRGLWPDLHQANLANTADGGGIIVALDINNGVGDVGRQTRHLDFTIEHGANGCLERRSRFRFWCPNGYGLRQFRFVRGFRLRNHRTGYQIRRARVLRLNRSRDTCACYRGKQGRCQKAAQSNCTRFWTQACFATAKTSHVSLPRAISYRPTTRTLTSSDI